MRSQSWINENGFINDFLDPFEFLKFWFDYKYQMFHYVDRE